MARRHPGPRRGSAHRARVRDNVDRRPVAALGATNLESRKSTTVVVAASNLHAVEHRARLPPTQVIGPHQDAGDLSNDAVTATGRAELGLRDLWFDLANFD